MQPRIFCCCGSLLGHPLYLPLPLRPLPPRRWGCNVDGLEHQPKLVGAVGVGLRHKGAARLAIRSRRRTRPIRSPSSSPINLARPCYPPQVRHFRGGVLQHQGESCLHSRKPMHRDGQVTSDRPHEGLILHSSTPLRSGVFQHPHLFHIHFTFFISL